ncbi:MAG: reductase [Myxococcales bacterium]|nr:reductase [Myxococcales bacterium]
MSLIVTISASPAQASRTQLLAAHVGAQLAARGHEVQTINVRDLPAESLLWGRIDAPDIARALDQIARADGVVIATPIYKASYTGVLKAFLDLLPQFGLQGKIVLPLATGGTLAHVLSIDYALRPVLVTLAAHHVVSGLFILDKLLERHPEGGLKVDPEIAGRFDAIVGEFAANLERRHAPPPPPLTLSATAVPVASLPAAVERELVPPAPRA